ncbi:hypothetical protein LguiA_002226 [Lonicera macranthoides]
MTNIEPQDKQWLLLRQLPTKSENSDNLPQRHNHPELVFQAIVSCTSVTSLGICSMKIPLLPATISSTAAAFSACFCRITVHCPETIFLLPQFLLQFCRITVHGA